MPDISLLNKDSVATDHSDVDELEVDTQDGGTTKYVSKHLILEQKQSDWNQNDDTQVDFIKNKYVHPATHPISMITGAADVASSGEYVDLRHKPFDELKTIFEDQTSKFELDDGIYGSNFIDTIEIFEGEQYRVTWDGSEHLCTCKRLYETTFLWLGNLAVFFTDAEDTGEPFLVSETGILTADSSETHTYSIVPVNTVKKIDSKYLPDMGSGLPDVTAADNGKVLGVVNGSPKWVEQSGTESGSNNLPSGFLVSEEKLTDILPKGDLTFSYNDSFGAYAAYAFYTEEIYQKWVSYDGLLRVVWDNVEYDLTMQHIADMSGVGNCTAFGGTGNGEPFAIGMIQESNADADGGYDYIMVIVEFTTEASHNVQVSFIGEESNVNRDYLPDPPTFDLAAMGLPALALDGQDVSVECDASELCAALGKGSVKILFTANVGVEVPVSGIVSAMVFDDMYQCGFIGELGVNIIVLRFVVNKTTINGRCIPLDLPT